MSKRILACFKRCCIMVADNVVKLCPGNISLHRTQMEKSFIVLSVPWRISSWQHGIKLHGNKRRVDHGIFGGAWMNVHTLENNFCTAGIEVFVLDLTFCIPIQSVGIVCTEFSDVKMCRSHADLFIWSKGNGKRAVRDFFRKDTLQSCDDLSDSGFIISTEDRSSV